MKIRVPPSDLFIDMIEALGGNPTPLAFGEVYSALGTHLIDGGENNIRSFHTSRQFEVARYWSTTSHSYSPEALLISSDRFNELGAQNQAALIDAAQRSVPFMRELWDRAEAESLEKLRADGVHFNEVDLPAFRAAARPLLESLAADPVLRRTHSLIREAA
jgi:TRAP-type C4-dicarboxylate transport system substrate-binding protein